MKNNHHLFTKGEIREKLIDMLGEPNSDSEMIFFYNKSKEIHKKMPQFKIDIEKHRLIHEKENIKRRQKFKNIDTTKGTSKTMHCIECNGLISRGMWCSSECKDKTFVENFKDYSQTHRKQNDE